MRASVLGTGHRVLARARVWVAPPHIGLKIGKPPAHDLGLVACVPKPFTPSQHLCEIVTIEQLPLPR